MFHVEPHWTLKMSNVVCPFWMFHVKQEIKTAD